ncbi:MAG: exodeoxyribonuclease III [Gammaproteobacteria bacterium]
MRIITINLNGIRSAAKKGFFTWLKSQNADVICMQEVKAQQADITDEIFRPEGYHGYFHFAEKKGYSGVGIYTKQEPTAVKTGLGWSLADQEGRYVEITLGKLNIASLYLPSGSSGEERQASKFDFLARYSDLLQQQRKQDSEFIICGDWNIAHRQIDLKNWRGNQKNSGFLPEERAWMDELFGNIGFIDAFRHINQEPDQYTWWSNRGQAWAKNVGWRIDYQVVTPGLKDKIKSVSIYKDQRFSDHAPLLIDYDIISLS